MQIVSALVANYSISWFSSEALFPALAALLAGIALLGHLRQQAEAQRKLIPVKVRKQ